MSALPSVSSLAGPELVDFRRRLEARLEQAVSFADGSSGRRGRETLQAGGKRLRPLLVYLSSPLAGRGAPDLERGAAAVELVHMASLVHDDVLDRAALRRGLPTVWATHGDAVATATGDYLFARAFAVLAETGNAPASALLADCALALSRGEALQKLQARRPETTPAEYLARCTLKTGALFATACVLGARLGGASDPGTVAALHDYGRSLGLAFQVADDVLDCDGTPEATGKALGTDLIDGTPTLPLLLAARDDRVVAAALRHGVRPADVLGVLHRVGATGALEAARAEAYRHVRAAEAALERLGDDFDLPALGAVAHGVVNRDS
ncbi:MAG: Heptaprenyl diphosphate synthase component II [uncultured Thermoleophilia bacterium]|uniref:Heptaprenyl diphosphate synthase component II n=1 Tax=uncultured Thermoleophilia bacterium TaxID=1497501 RepID=A0A6J4TEK0_9ACTN|nr:MAG: Heptaprenyl diphosphate synthase component II [uncultured Thermoleophilia bacterium]